MDEKRSEPADSLNPGTVVQGQVNPAEPSSPAAVYSSDANKYYLDSSLEVNQAPVSSFASPLSGSQPPKRHSFTGISRRKALVVSAVITLFVTALTGTTILLLARNAPRRGESTNAVKTQDIALKNTESSDIPPELQGTAESLLVNGDVITKGTLKVTNNSFVTTIKSADLTSSQTFTLPNNSGTICVDSNNCSYARSDELNSLQQQLAQIVAVAGVSAVNNQGGSITLQGSLNRINVATSNGVITFSTPQNLDSNANVQFGNLTVGPGGVIRANSLQQTSAGNNVSINAGSDGITFTANGRTFTLPTTGAGSQLICTTGVTCASGGGLAVILSPTAVQTDNSADPSIFIDDVGGGNLLHIRSSSVDRLVVANNGDTSIFGNLTVSGLSSGGFVRSNGSGLLSVVTAIDLNSSDVTNTLPVNRGGTGSASLSASGVLVGNNTSPVNSVTASGAGLCLISTAGNPSFQACPGSTSGVDSVNALNGSIILQGTTNQVSVNTGAGTITLSTPQDINSAASPVFAGLTLSGLSNGVVKVNSGVLSGGLVALGSEVSGTLPVTNGGTGAASLTLNGVIVGNGSGALTSVTAGAPGECLISTAGAPSFQTCPGGAGGAPSNATYLTVTSDPTLSGERTLSVAGNLTFSDGGANGSYSIDTVNNPTFSVSVNTPLLQSSGALTITPAGTLTAGAINQTLTLQGNATTTLRANDSGNTTTVGFAVPTANRSITFPNESGTVCLVGSPNCGFAGSGSGVTSLDTLTGALTLANSSGVGSTITIDNASTSAKGIAQFNSTNFTAASGTINTIQGIALTSTPQFAGLTLTGDLTLGTSNVVRSNTYRQTANGQDLLIDANGDDITFFANGQSFVFPSSGGAMQTICTSGISCVAGGGQAVILEPGAVQSANSNDTAIFVDKASGSGNLIQLQTGGVDKFVINNSGAITLDNATISNTLTVNTITPTGALTIGSSSQAFTVRGNGSSSIVSTNSGFTTTVGFVGTPVGNTTYQFRNDNTLTPGTYDICTTAGNCTGVGGSITGSGTPGAIAKFSTSSAIADSIISENTGVITIAGALGVTGANGITTGNPSVTNGTLKFANSTNVNLITLQSGGTGSATISVPAANGTIAVSASGPLALDANGNLTCATCLTSGGGGAGGVSSLNTLTGALTVANSSGVGSTITINDASTAQKGIAQFNSTNFSASLGTINTIQNIATSSSPTFTNLTLQGSNGLTVGSTTNLGKVSFLDGTNDGFITTFQPATLTANRTITLPNASGTIAVAASGNVQLSAMGNITTVNNPTFSTSVSTPLLQSSGALTITPNGALTVGATSQTFTLQGNASSTISATDSGSTTTVGFTAPTGNRSINFPDESGTVCLVGSPSCGFAGGGSGVTSLNSLTGALTINNASGVGSSITINDATTGTKGIASFNGSHFSVASGAVSIADGAITTGKIADSNVTNAKLQNSSLTVTASTGLSGGGTISLGSSANLSVVYGSTSSSAVRGDTSLTCPSGTGNLTGGGTTITLGSGGTCAALNTVASPTFTGTLTVQGSSGTIGQSGTQGSLVLYDGGSGGAAHTATLQAISTLAQNTTYTLPDPGGASATICISTGNCAGAGQGVTQSGTNASGQIAYFTSSNNLTSMSGFTWNGTNTLTFGQASTITSGANNLNINSSGTIAIGSSSAGNVNIGTGAFAHTIGIGSDPGAAQGVSIGSTNASSTTLIQGGTGASAVAIQAGASGTISLGSNAVGKTINIGVDNLATGTFTENINIGGSSNLNITTNVNIGPSVGGTGGGTTSIKSGSGGIRIGDASSNGTTVSLGSTINAITQTVNVGANATASSNTTLNLGSTIGSSTTNIRGGSGGINVTTGALSLGVASSVGGDLVLRNATNSNTVTVRTGATSTSYNFVLPTSAGNSGDCLTNSGTPGTLTFQSCSAGLNLQTAYTASTGGTTSEIKLDATRGAVDIQDRSTSSGGTIGANLFNVRATAANDSTAGTLLFSIGNTGAVLMKNSVNSATAFQIQTAASATPFFAADTNNSTPRIIIGNATAGLSTSALVVTTAEFTGRVVIGTTSNGVDTNSGQIRYTGTYRQNRTLTLRPEFDGAVFSAKGPNNTASGNNVGTLNSSFCSNENSVTINSTQCGTSGEDHSYYEWTHNETSDQDYYIYARVRIPDDYDAGATYGTDITFRGFASKSASGADNKAEISLYNASGNLCGATTDVTNGTANQWSTGTIIGSTSGDSDCTAITAGSYVTFAIKLTANSTGTTGEIIRMGEIQIAYKSMF